MRELSTSTVLVATTIAQRVGMGPNDLKCAELLVRSGPMTAGQLAAASGLSTGAITGIVDRLEAAGWARRAADPRDRRRIIVHPGPQDNPKTTAELYATYQARMDALLDGYSDEQLHLVLEFVRRLIALNRAEAGRTASDL